jgi:drug/metabolite transporter (DMT)-like permease
MIDRKTLGATAALGSAASWAIGAILNDVIVERMEPAAMTLAKSAMGVVLLGITVFVVEKLTREERSLLRQLRSTDRRSLFMLAFSGVLGISVADTLFFEALGALSAHSVVLLMMVGFVLTPALAMLFLKEKSTLGRWLGIGLVLGGIVVVQFANVEKLELAMRVRGILFGLLSVVAMSISFVVAKKALESFSALQGTLIRVAFGTLGMFVVGIASGSIGGWLAPFRDIGFFVFFASAVYVVTFGAFWLTHAAIKYLDLTIANTLMATEPLFALFLAALFLGQRVTVIACVGTLVSLGGVAVLLRAMSEKKPAADDTQTEAAEHDLEKAES